MTHSKPCIGLYYVALVRLAAGKISLSQKPTHFSLRLDVQVHCSFRILGKYILLMQSMP